MAQHAPLRFGQQVIAPIERCAERPMPGNRGTASAGQQGEAVAQAGGYLLEAKCGSARRRKFNGERYAVEVATDRGNRRKVCGVRCEVRVQRFCSGDKKLYRTLAQNMVRFLPPDCR